MKNSTRINNELTLALAAHAFPLMDEDKPRPSRAKDRRAAAAATATGKRPAGTKRVLKAMNRKACTQGGHLSMRQSNVPRGTLRLHDLELDEMH